MNKTVKRTNRHLAIVAVAALTAGVVGTVAAEERKSYPAPDGHPLSEIISGYEFRNAETKALQDEDFDNPGFLWVDIGAEQWTMRDGSEQKACADCHGDAADSMKTAGAEFPKWNEALKQPVTMEGQINHCRKERMGAGEWKWDSDELLGMTAFVKHQARGVPVNVQVDGPMQPVFEQGKEIYYTRNGQLDLACASCHESNYGKYIRADFLSQGQSNGFPTYRLKWQKMGSLHRRFKGCMEDVRAEAFKVGGPEFTALELYLAWRGQGLPVETPSVRN